MWVIPIRNEKCPGVNAVVGPFDTNRDAEHWLKVKHWQRCEGLYAHEWRKEDPASHDSFVAVVKWTTEP